jgi:arylsulfatase A-like enzyme
MIQNLSRCLLTLLFVALANFSHAASKPNIIIILADDLGYADLGVHGCKDIHTPHIDSIAKNGIRCTNGYASSPTCSPSRAGLLAGRYQQRFGHEFNPVVAENNSPLFSAQDGTLPRLLKNAGYKTGMVGKWHLGTNEKFNPINQGFDEYFGFLGNANTYTNGKNINSSIVRGTKPHDEQEYLTDAFGREAVAFVDKQKKDPFFLYLAFNAVHAPLQASPKHDIDIDRIPNPNRRTYASMLFAMDDAIGKLLAKLEKENLIENTLIFFTSDNGGSETVNFSDNGHLKGTASTTWEGGIRVPFLVQWKSVLPKGKIYDHPVIHLDILPTVLAATEDKFSHKNKLDGINLLPYFNGENKEPPHEALYWRFGAQMAIRMGDWKLTKALDEDSKFNRADKASADGSRLYNLKKDIGETNNMSDSNPEKVKALTEAWNQWNKELLKPTWGQEKPKDK